MKKRIVAVAVVLTVVLAAGIFTWYKITLAQDPADETVINVEDETIYNSLSAVSSQKEYHFSAITAENAATVLEMINTADNFYAVFTAESFSGSTSASTKTKVWKNADKYRTESQGNLNKTCICNGQSIKITNDERGTSAVYPVSGGFKYSDEIGVADIGYILENTKADSRITSVHFARTAGIQTGGNIIYAEIYNADTDCREEFYVSIDYGVILTAQTFIADKLVYRLTTNEFIEDYLSDGTMFIIN